MDNKEEMSKAEEEKKDKDKEQEDEMDEKEIKKALQGLVSLSKSQRLIRREELLSKAQSGAGLSGDEADELTSLLKGERGSDSLVKQLQTEVKPSESLEKAMVENDALANVAESVFSTGVMLAKSMEKIDSDQETRTMALAKALVEIGQVTLANMKLVKSLRDELREFVKAPVRTPKVADAIEKSRAPTASTAGVPAAPQRDTSGAQARAALVSTLEDLLQKSFKEELHDVSRDAIMETLMAIEGGGLRDAREMRPDVAAAVMKYGKK